MLSQTRSDVHRQSNDNKIILAEDQRQLAIPTQREPRMPVNRVAKIWKSFENEWKLLKQEQTPPSRVEKLLFDDPDVRKILYDARKDGDFARFNHSIGCRVEPLKLRFRAVEDIKEMKHKTQEEMSTEHGVLRDLLWPMSEILLKLQGTIVWASKCRRERRTAARRWQRELREMKVYFARYESGPWGGDLDLSGSDDE